MPVGRLEKLVMLLTRRTENLSGGDGSLDPQVELNLRATGTVGLGS